MAKLVLPLMGGLGNQLFQLQAALSLFEGEIELLGSIGKPRITEGVPDIFHGVLPKRVQYRNVRRNPLINKTHSLVLRIFLNPHNSSQLRRFVTIFSSIIFSIYLLKPMRVVAATDLGFCSIEKIKGNTVLIGYFQSYKWNYESLKNIFPVSISQQFQNLTLESKTKNICILHIRRTDYLLEKDFGLISSAYYEKALDIANKEVTLDEIWLFSDDLSDALMILPEKYRNQVRVIDDTRLKPIEVLQTMTLGNVFVTANSSFSWWAARLSNANLVIAPEPWFVATSDPNELIPDDWLRLNRFVE